MLCYCETKITHLSSTGKKINETNCTCTFLLVQDGISARGATTDSQVQIIGHDRSSGIQQTVSAGQDDIINRNQTNGIYLYRTESVPGGPLPTPKSKLSGLSSHPASSRRSRQAKMIWLIVIKLIVSTFTGQSPCQEGHCRLPSPNYRA